MKKFLTVIVIALSLTACGESPEEQNAKLQEQLKEAQSQINSLQQQAAAVAQPPQVIQQAPAQPVVVQAPAAQQGNDLLETVAGVAAGVAVGNMLTGAGSSGGYSRPVIQHRTTIVNKTVYKASKSTKPSYFRSPRPSFKRR